MRKISSMKNKELQKEQFQVFCDLVSKLSKNEQKLFFDKFLSESEKCYLSQRLNIMRMLIKNFSYSEIKEKLGVPSATISRANDVLENEDKLQKLISIYKYKKIENINKKNFIKEKSKFFEANYPGAIKF